ncbi:hypothetical protein PNEG_00246 [Pneumocystis murina B123]|uniref:Ribosomal lysine N-methyltransferase 4 n=1 Tax=Pneumocystis murina (strain B123) TaxID=1069680 RepID=M7NXD0_PNEMU|nr:hypothetical protein PNEG_00246 [Pneumocystis murina B123]EMR11821.1 hypothetical protein PNEG_00246 [Pneumocystis murina B123]
MNTTKTDEIINKNIDQQRISILMDWLKSKNIYIHSAIKLGKRDDGFFVYTEKFIKKNTIILKVPKNAILSPKTSLLSFFLDKTKIPSILSVCIVYMYEKSLGQKSPWYGYLQIMPDKVDIPKLWNHEKKWLKGTEIEYVGGLDISELQSAYNELILPFIKKNKEILNQRIFTYNNFLKAISVVRSRVFEIDKFHNLGLVPFADMFNHATNEHIHFQTFYNVCRHCGLIYCKHIFKLKKYKKTQYEDTCDMIVHNSPSAFDEVYNTYGTHGNDILLSRYGFALHKNKWDRISMSKIFQKNDMKSDRLLWWKLNGFNASYKMGLFKRYFSKNDIKNYFSSDSNNHNDKEIHSYHNIQYLFLQDSLFITFPSDPSSPLIFFIILLSLSHKLFKNLEKNTKKTNIYILNIIRLQLLYFHTGSIKNLKYQKYTTLLIIFKINKFLSNAIDSRLKKYNQTLILDNLVYENIKTQENKRKHWTKIVLQNEIDILNNTKKKCIKLIHKTKLILKYQKLYSFKIKKNYF